MKRHISGIFVTVSAIVMLVTTVVAFLTIDGCRKKPVDYDRQKEDAVFLVQLDPKIEEAIESIKQKNTIPMDEATQQKVEKLIDSFAEEFEHVDVDGKKISLQAKDKIDNMLAANPGWIPAVILDSAYYRYIETASNTAIAVLASIETAVNDLDPDIYLDFLAGYTIYESALETEELQIFTEQQKEARLVIAQEIFEYFPASELVALYYVPSGQ